MRMNKKGLGTALTLLLSVMVIALFFFLFFKYFDFGSKAAERTIRENTKSVEDSIILINYLKSPVGDDKVIADLIEEHYSEGKGEDMIKEETNKIFRAVYGENVFWKLEIEDKTIKNSGTKAGIKSIEQEAVIPSYKNEILKIKLIVE